MGSLLILLVAFIAVSHVCFFLVESVFWETAFAARILRMTPPQAGATSVLARNQGFYNLFLAGGLVWALIAVEPLRTELQFYFLSCIVIAGIVGGITSSRLILLVQALPAFVSLIFLYSLH